MTELREEVGVAFERGGDVGERPERDQVVSAGFVRRDVEQCGDRIVRRGSARRFGKVGAAHAVGAVHELRRVEWAHQGPVATGVQRDLGASGQIEGDDGVAHRQVERHVAGDDGDGAHVDRWFANGEHERDRVVGRGIGVDHDAAARHPRSLAAIGEWSPPGGTDQNSESCPRTSVAGTTGSGVGSGARSPIAAATSAWSIRASFGDSRFSG